MKDRILSLRHRWPILPLLPKSMGYRGSILFIFGLSWVTYGVGVVDAPAVHWSLAYGHLPVAVRVAGWVVTGTYAIAMSVNARFRDDSWAWVALYLMPSLYAISHLGAWAISAIAWDGYARAWVGLAIWCLLMAIVMICAGWPEPDDKEQREMTRDQLEGDEK